MGYNSQCGEDKRNGLVDRDIAPVTVVGGVIEVVLSFFYLGSVLSSNGEVMEDIKCRIYRTSRTYDWFKTSVFENRSPSLRIKKAIY